MHEYVEDLHGVEVIVDDFPIAGFGDTEDGVFRSLETNESAFFEKCSRWNLKLNRKKVKRGKSSVRFMCHLLTSEGPKAYMEKSKAIFETSETGDITALKRFLRMYLVRPSDMTESLRRLDDKDVEFQWTNSHTAAMDAIKKALTEAPVLCYDVTKPVTIQCDASGTGLGAVLLQGGQPICYASRALTDTEKRYAQIDQELLAIVWYCDKFDQYIYGRDIVTIECDHEPLKAGFKEGHPQVSEEITAHLSCATEVQPRCAV